MSVISVEAKYGSLVGTGTLEGVRTYTKTYRVITNSASDGVMTVGNDSRIPHKGNVYTWHGETDPGALCYSVTPRRDTDNELIWMVECQYSSDLGGGSPSNLKGDPRYDVDNPLDAPPEVVWSYWEETETIDTDVTGKAILNTANRPFEPGLTRRRKQRMVVITRNEATFPIAVDQEYVGTINEDVFYDWPPRTAKLEDVSAVARFSQGMLYWQVRYEIRFRKPDWRVYPANRGIIYLEQNNVTGDWEEVVPHDKNTIYHTDPVWLGTDGQKLTKLGIETAAAIPPGNPGSLYLAFNIYVQKPFNLLGL